jgi:putative ABC transport system substrate-binding protein
MRRREFIGALCGWTAFRSLEAHAQQRERQKLVGIVSAFSEAEMKPLRATFVGKLSALGWKEADNLEVDLRLARGTPAALAEAAAALAQRQPDVIVAQGSPALTAVQAHRNAIPVVFLLVSDPVGLGFVKTLARPGGDLTGFTNFEISVGGKWVGLLKQLNPRLSRILLIANPNNPASALFSKQIEAAARSIDVDVATAHVSDAAEIEKAIRMLTGSPQAALITLPDFVPVLHRDLIVKLTNELGVASIHPFRTFPLNGGLMSYGLDFPELYRQVAVYVDRILRGAKPADLPVQAPTKFELVVNMKAAKALGIDVPPALVTQADEVIE